MSSTETVPNTARFVNLSDSLGTPSLIRKHWRKNWVGHLLWFREQTVKLSCLQVRSHIVTAHDLDLYHSHSGRKFSFTNAKWSNISVQFSKDSKYFFAKSSSTFISLKSKLTLTFKFYIFLFTEICRNYSSCSLLPSDCAFLSLWKWYKILHTTESKGSFIKYFSPRIELTSDLYSSSVLFSKEYFL